MIKNAFIESLKIVDGRFIHPELHWQRITDTQRVHFGNSTFLPLSSESIPPDKRLGTLKCRIIYDQEIRKIDFETYSPRRVHTLKLVDGSGIDYTFKYADRDKLIQLQQSKGTCDEILIYQNGRITDTSYSNVVFYDGNQYITPSTYLLNGTKRRYLLEREHHKRTGYRPRRPPPIPVSLSDQCNAGFGRQHSSENPGYFIKLFIYIFTLNAELVTN